MAGKGKFIYVFGDSTRIKVADSAFPYNSDTDFAFPLSKFSTDDLLKLKAQVATELENRMDLDGVVEQNLEKLKAQIRGAKGEVVEGLVNDAITFERAHRRLQFAAQRGDIIPQIRHRGKERQML